MIDQGLINNWFTYHAPDSDQVKIYEAIRSHGREFAHVINNLVPDGPDKTVALRTLREAVMWANAAVATHTDPPADGVAFTPAPAPVRKAESPYQTTAGVNSRVAAAATARHRAQTLDEMVQGFVDSKVGA